LLLLLLLVRPPPLPRAGAAPRPLPTPRPLPPSRPPRLLVVALAVLVLGSVGATLRSTLVEILRRKEHKDAFEESRTVLAKTAVFSFE
jgi:hypothetical protein